MITALQSLNAPQCLQEETAMHEMNALLQRLYMLHLSRKHAHAKKKKKVNKP